MLENMAFTGGALFWLCSIGGLILSRLHYKTLALIAFLAVPILVCVINPGIKHSMFSEISSEIATACQGVLFSFVVSNVWVMFLGPLIGIWKPFAKPYVYSGTVSDGATLTTHYADTTSHVNALGHVRSSTEYSSLSNDVLNIHGDDDKHHQIAGEGLTKQARQGHKIVWAGAKGSDHFMLHNVSTEKTFGGNPGGLLSVYGGLLVTLIPVIGQMYVIFLIIRQLLFRKGLSESCTFDQESRHLWLLAITHCLVLAICYPEFSARGITNAAIIFYVLMIPLCALQGYLWRKNCLRYGKFIAGHVQSAMQKVAAV